MHVAIGAPTCIMLNTLQINKREHKNKYETCWPKIVPDMVLTIDHAPVLNKSLET